MTTVAERKGLSKELGGERDVVSGAGLGQVLWRNRSAILLLAVLLLFTVVTTRGIGEGEFHYVGDEPQQAVTGLYFADFLSDLPFTHPVLYTFRYYAQYPALGLIHWPPFFHFMEGVMFLLLGPSVVAARLTTLLFAIVGFTFWFLLVRELQDEWTAAASTVLLAFLPSLLVFERTVMLEIPAMALCIAAFYFWVRHLKSGESRLLWWFVGFASLALLTKQNSVYLAAFCLLLGLSLRGWRLLKDLRILRAFLVCLLLAGPFYLAAFALHSNTIFHDAFRILRAGPNTPAFDWHRYAYFWTMLPRQLGLPILLLSVLGLVTCRWWAKRDTVVAMLAWIFGCYIAATLVTMPDSRHTIYWLPPFVLFAVGPLTAKCWARPVRLLARVTVLALLAGQTASAWTYQRPYISGYAPAARYLLQNSRSGIVLFDGEVPGNFIFFLRAYDPARRFVVMRKALYVSRIEAAYGSEELLHSQSELEDLLNQYGIEKVVVLDPTRIRFGVQETLRALLQTSQFRRLKAFPIETNEPSWKGRSLLIYQNNQAPPRTAKNLRIRMLTLDRDIIVPLDRLGVP